MTRTVELRVPDIGDFKDVAVIEVLFKAGDRVEVGDALVTLESDKAALDVPAERAGRILSIQAVQGSRVSKGSRLLTLEYDDLTAEVEHLSPAESPVPAELDPPPAPAALPSSPASAVLPPRRDLQPSEARAHASPSVRRMAREFDIDLCRVKGCGARGRILKSDIQDYLRGALAARESDGAAASSGERPPNDYSQFGPVERRALSRIQRISGQVLARNWSAIPHVTNFEDADITDLDAFRRQLAAESKAGPKITLLGFLVKACAACLKAFPAVNASLDGAEMILKKYVHVGVAVDAPAGLVVPVIRNADQLGIRDISGLIESHALRARQGKLAAADLEGGCFTVSSLGGIGSTAFTPIINAPEVAILGVSRASVQPRWDGVQFVPRTILPLALSWDHRALDGVVAARFLVHLAQLLQDFRRVAL